MAKDPHPSLKTAMGPRLTKRSLQVLAIDLTVLEPADGKENVLLMTCVYQVCVGSSNKRSASTDNRQCSREEWFLSTCIPTKEETLNPS